MRDYIVTVQTAHPEGLTYCRRVVRADNVDDAKAEVESYLGEDDTIMNARAIIH